MSVPRIVEHIRKTWNVSVSDISQALMSVNRRRATLHSAMAVILMAWNFIHVTAGSWTEAVLFGTMLAVSGAMLIVMLVTLAVTLESDNVPQRQLSLYGAGLYRTVIVFNVVLLMPVVTTIVHEQWLSTLMTGALFFVCGLVHMDIMIISYRKALRASPVSSRAADWDELFQQVHE